MGKERDLSRWNSRCEIGKEKVARDEKENHAESEHHIGKDYQALGQYILNALRSTCPIHKGNGGEVRPPVESCPQEPFPTL